MKALRNLLVIAVTFVAGAYAGSWYTLGQANQQLSKLTLFGFATDLRHNVAVAESLEQGRADDAMDAVNYVASTTYAVLCAKAQRADDGLDVYVSEAITAAAGQLDRADCMQGHQL